MALFSRVVYDVKAQPEFAPCDIRAATLQGTYIDVKNNIESDQLLLIRERMKLAT